MNARRSSIALFFFLAGLAAAPATPPLLSQEEKEECRKFLTLGEMMKAMETSKTTYKIDVVGSLKDLGPRDFAEAYWPASDKELNYPWIETDVKGGRTLTSFEFDKKAFSLVKKAEPVFQAKKYDKAMKLYLQAIEGSPRCYVAFINLGDCYFFTGDHAKALEQYEKGIAVNPYDFAGHFFKAHALVKLGRYDDAKAAYVRSLALRPHRKSVMASIRENADRLGVTLADEPFLPKSVARREGETVAIYTDPGNLPWLAHAVCKGFWLGEPQHRKDMGVTSDKGWSLSEERECLASLLTGYLLAREDGKTAEDPELERMVRILRDDLIDGFITYEMISRVGADTMALLPDETQDKVRGYIAKYVLVSREGSDGGKGNAEDGP